MVKDFIKEIDRMQIYDVHTHLNPNHMTARGLHDIMLYHMVVSELYSAGCPDGSRLSDSASEEEIANRIEAALPFLPLIKNTSIYNAMKTILSDLYDWREIITVDNWRNIDAKIRAYNDSCGRAEEIFAKSGVKSAVAEYSSRMSDKYDHLLSYSLEWAFFARNQWNQYDTALLELEHAWSQNEPGSPLPVTLSSDIVFSRRIACLDDIHKAISHYCEKIPIDKIVSTAQHFSTDIDYLEVDDNLMIKAIANRGNAGCQERNIYASYILKKFLHEFEKKCKGLVFQFSFGAEPLKYETGSKLRTNSVFDLSDIINKYPEIDFQVMLSSAHQNQSICTLIRENQNLSIAGYWWHNFFPVYIKRLIEERLDLLPLNKQIGFFSDAYCVEWMYAKSKIVKHLIAEVLHDKVKKEQYSFSEAIDIAGEILVNTPSRMFK